MLDINNIANFLNKNKYEVLDSNIPIIKFCVKSEEGSEAKKLICIVDNTKGAVFSPEDLQAIIFQIERKVIFSGSIDITSLVIILSDDIERDKMYVEEESRCWLIDAKTRELLVYENQPEDFDGIKEELSKVCFQGFFEESKIAKKNSKLENMSNFPIVTALLILVNIIVYIYFSYIGNVYNPKFILDHGGLYFENVLDNGEYYRLFTSMFIHYGIDHLFSNMVALIFIGNEVEKIYGHIRFTLIYFLSGIIGGLFSILYYNHVNKIVVSAGASGAIYGLLAAVVVFAIQGVKGKSRNLFQKALFIAFILIMVGKSQENIDNIAHLGGFISGLFFGLLAYFSMNIKTKSKN